MPGPHPAVAAVRSAVRAGLRAAAPGRRILIACSGGADSVALAAATAFEAPRSGHPAGLITVDHGLQAGSADIARRVAALAAELDLDPVEIVPVSVGRARGPEAAARSARYAALGDAAAALDADVLLGHTLDDQAETVLLALGRGSGGSALAGMAAVTGIGMPAVAGVYRRPLLGLRRATTAAACAALGLPVWDDPHNADPAFTRARVRHEALPLLEDVLHGGVAEALARTGDQLRDDRDALAGWATDVLNELRDGDDLDADRLASLPRAVRTRVLRAWVTALTGPRPLSAERTAALDALVVDWHGQGPVELAGPVAVHRTGGRLRADRPAPRP